MRFSTLITAVMSVGVVSGITFDLFAAETDGLAADLLPLIQSHQGNVSVAVRHMKTGESFLHEADRVMPTASLIKLAVMAEAYRQSEVGDVDLNQLVELTGNDKVPGSGILTKHFSAGTKISLRDAVQLMIAYSDNTATNLVLNTIGLASVGMSTQKLGLPETRINALVYRADTSIDPERSRLYGLGSTTANETLRLLEMLHRGELVSKEASSRMLQHLRDCQDESKLESRLPEGTTVAHKSGAVGGIRCDAGIIYSENGAIAVCVLTSNNEDKRWNEDNAGSVLCGRLARAAYDHFNPMWKAGTRDDKSPLNPGAVGVLVEHLQRTLNVRLKPSPILSVDGDFGPVTQSAVERFQKAAELKPTGIVDQQTWKALGPLVTRAEPVPDPERINLEPLEVEPADELTGRPFVTCKAWAVADGTTGEVLWGDNESTPLDFASTTKIMTAWLVVKQADKSPDVLDEIVTFSRRADQTHGSTSGIKTGEKISVREILYGLMLPSGNDASVALAEHFGERLRTDADSDKKDPLRVFVAAMNREAAHLGMAETHYENPHGLTKSGHVASARDLITLASTAMRSELFRSYVSTRQRGCRVSGPGGYTRNVQWKNTNQLLGIDGYAGLKTGTTSAAGACLVSLSLRGDDSLLLVTLGSAASAARYTDSRNLFRWAWQKRLGDE